MAGVRPDDSGAAEVMRYHDHSLCGYEVRDFGGTIVFHLQLKASDGTAALSTICFDGVVFYHFIHTCPAVILDVTEIPLQKFVSEHQEQLSKWQTQQGVIHWSDSSSDYLATLRSESVKAWIIESAIGFTGCVLAKQVRQIE